jgi:hypothetical protein
MTGYSTVKELTDEEILQERKLHELTNALFEVMIQNPS